MELNMNPDDPRELQALDARIRTVLPEQYQHCYEDVQPASMGSAALKFGPDGKVAWDEIWGSFCDLAMAGGPPHKGKLLEPGAPADIGANPDRYREVVDEICRGVRMVTGLAAQPASEPGWVRVACPAPGMSGWLVRAIVMENVWARFHQAAIDLPAGPDYRIEKEIKNVITVIAKTCHYYLDHMWAGQQRDIAEMFERLERESPLLQPAPAATDVDAIRRDGLTARIADAIHDASGLKRSGHRYTGWLGLECPSVSAAIWMMRALVVSNVLARREECVLFVPVHPAVQPARLLHIRAQKPFQVLGRQCAFFNQSFDSMGMRGRSDRQRRVRKMQQREEHDPL
jgi:hypothetical protein